METTLRGAVGIEIAPHISDRELDVWVSYADYNDQGNVESYMRLSDKNGKLYASTSLDNMVIGVQFMPLKPLPQHKVLSKKELSKYDDFSGTFYVTFRDNSATNTMALFDLNFKENKLSLYNRAFCNGLTIGSKEQAVRSMDLDKSYNLIHLNVLVVELTNGDNEDMDGVSYFPITIAMPLISEKKIDIVSSGYTIEDNVEAIYKAVLGEENKFDKIVQTLPNVYAVTKTKTVEVQQTDLTLEAKDV